MQAPIYVNKEIVRRDAIEIIRGRWRGDNAKTIYDVSLDRYPPILGCSHKKISLVNYNLHLPFASSYRCTNSVISLFIFPWIIDSYGLCYLHMDKPSIHCMLLLFILISLQNAFHSVSSGNILLQHCLEYFFCSAVEGPDLLAEELDLVRKMNTAIIQERYGEAGCVSKHFVKLIKWQILK